MGIVDPFLLDVFHQRGMKFCLLGEKGEVETGQAAGNKQSGAKGL